MEKKDELLKIFARRIRETLGRCNLDMEKLQEIRLRVNRPLLVVEDGREYWIGRDGGCYPAGSGRQINENSDSRIYIIRPDELRETVEYMGNYSLYAFEEEIRQGFITVPGGHRVGLAGRMVLDGGEIRTIKYISFINVRMAHQIKGCADPVMPYLYKNGQALHTLIISPPRCGKTTLLRDIIRQMSDRYGLTVGVVDERSEIAACYSGIPQNDLGIRTDVLDCCPKARGMMMLIRSMSPQVIAIDEIGGQDDLEAMEYVMNCGCKLIATVHGNSLEDLLRKPVLRRLVEGQVFERYILLGGKGKAGTVEEISDEKKNILYRRCGCD